MTPSGILLLDKPAGCSSNQALQRVRRLLGAPKAGHVGSLDPLATGMLPICLGEATKIAADILAGRKCYRFAIALGARTATGDTEGEIIERAPVPALRTADIAAALKTFLGSQQQIPPMYSAIKRGGRPLYELARAGIEVAREPRRIEISALELLEHRPLEIALELVCSKGTYVRSLAEDLARRLGTCGHVSMLRRLYVEPFEAEPMQTLESLENAIRARGTPRLLAPDEPLQHLPLVRLDARQARRVLQGQSIETDTPPALRVRLYDDSGTFLGIGSVAAGGLVQPRRLFVRSSSAACGPQ